MVSSAKHDDLSTNWVAKYEDAVEEIVQLKFDLQCERDEVTRLLGELERMRREVDIARAIVERQYH
jgi:hypothetical protein